MIAKIGRSSNLYGALAYNHHKVEKRQGQILLMNKMVESTDGKYTIPQLMRSFDPYLTANQKTEKHTLHISLNPDPNDKVSDKDFVKMAEEYMNGMGYGEQPYMVFKHTDIDRTHIHIVSVCVDENGKKISDRFEKRRSMNMCRQLENTYNLWRAAESQNVKSNLVFKPVDYQIGNIKHQIGSVIRNIADVYSFKTFGEYSALLSIFNIAVEKIEGELHGKPQRGLVYFALDTKKHKTGNPLKASRIGREAQLAAVESHFLKNKESVLQSAKSELKVMVDNALKGGQNEKYFVENLNSIGINTVIRRNEAGRMYGITFIDHNSKTVWNGSNLGKQYSAAVFNDLWKDHEHLKKTSDTKQAEPKSPPTNQFLPSQLHPLFEFLNDNNDNIHDIESMDSFPGLLPTVQGEDYEEQVFSEQMRKRKKRRKR
ncbi:Relaxase/Mobilisation nuclease domain-containing protein [Chryseobacterium ureilyticum]|uniref:Relaxase/Mobilisation nuclease domain-containing protein n=1 Tax=Chryseobacterium ureilyticum TaxID=373668 RepID=A0A1N7LDQ7_9FLAO|nr:conjugal transfer protein MobB [Chryseobacterium ureilyticum]SIS71964.1 Relaxase/Mobilisation nuclease domain-containing protein [Chryseobacterium ureilyticum]